MSIINEHCFSSVYCLRPIRFLLCAGDALNDLLVQYEQISKELRDLKSRNGNPDRIAALEMALEIVVGGLDVNEYGMTVIALTDRGSSLDFNIPTLTFEGKTHALAEVAIAGSSQVKITFTRVGICGFANPTNGSA